jgi:nematocidal protein AidA
MMAILESTNIITNVQIVIDTDKVIKDVPNPSKDPNKPTGLAHNYQYMIVSGNQGISGTATADLNFQAFTGDVVRMTMSSEYDNLDNPVFIYKIVKFGGSDVFGDFLSQQITSKTVVPGVPSPLPPTMIDRTFWYYQANVQKMGVEQYQVWFAMYQRVRGGNPVLYGYFYWDPTITVNA